ncbi:beta-ketoacyl-ACP synthase III [Planctomycetota bacterium]
MSKVKIIGVGSYLPSTIITNNSLSEVVDTTDEWIVQRTGIKHRRFASDEEATSDLCVFAAEKAIVDAKIEKNAIDLLLVATATPDQLVACTSAVVQHKLGLNKTAGYEIASACSGFVNSFLTAWQFLCAGSYKTALVIGGETLSKFVNIKDRTTCIIFGDGAGAVVMQSYEGEGISDILSGSMGMDGSGTDKLLMPAGGSRMPTSIHTVEKKLHFIHMQGRDIYKFAVRKMAELIQQELVANQWTPEDVNMVIPHQVNLRILESAAKMAEIPMDRMLININKYGNTSSASIPIALNEAVCRGKVKRGSKIIFVAFGAGLTWSSASLIW